MPPKRQLYDLTDDNPLKSAKAVDDNKTRTDNSDSRVETDGDALVEDNDMLVGPSKSALYLGFSGETDPYLLRNFNYVNNYRRFLNYGIRQVSKDARFPAQFMVIDRFPDKVVAEKQRKRIQQLISPEIQQRLIDLFFIYVYPLYPIVDRSMFEKEMERGVENVGLLAGIMAMASIWWKYDPVLCLKRSSNLQDITDKLFKECAEAVFRDTLYPELSTVQCLLLLLQQRFHASANAQAYNCSIYIGRAVSVSYTLALHLDCREWSIPLATKKLRVKLWSAIWMMDRWLAANLSRPPLINTDYTTRIPPSLGSESTFEEHVAEIFDADADAPVYYQMLSLTRVLDSTLKSLYTVVNQRERVESYEYVHRESEKLINMLESWREQLPDDIKTMEPRPEDMSLPDGRLTTNVREHGILHLSALTIEVLIQRARLQPQWSGELYDYIQEYRVSAYSTMDRIIKKFMPYINQPYLKACWYSTTRINFATLGNFILTIHLSSTDQSEYEKTRKVLRKWLDAAKNLGHGWAVGPPKAEQDNSEILDEVMHDNLFKSEATAKVRSYATTARAKTSEPQTSRAVSQPLPEAGLSSEDHILLMDPAPILGEEFTIYDPLLTDLLEFGYDSII